MGMTKILFSSFIYLIEFKQRSKFTSESYPKKNKLTAFQVLEDG